MSHFTRIGNIVLLYRIYWNFIHNKILLFIDLTGEKGWCAVYKQFILLWHNWTIFISMTSPPLDFWIEYYIGAKFDRKRYVHIWARKVCCNQPSKSYNAHSLWYLYGIVWLVFNMEVFLVRHRVHFFDKLTTKKRLEIDNFESLIARQIMSFFFVSL